MMKLSDSDPGKESKKSLSAVTLVTSVVSSPKLARLKLN
jgi:hypothetical protein